jgi:hypothetical protein
MTALSSDLSARVAKLLPRLASDQQGEVAAVAAALTRTLKSGGCDLHDLAQHIAEGPREIVVYRERAPQPGPSPFDSGAWRGAYHRSHPNGTHRYRITRCKQVGAGRLSAWEVTFLGSLERHIDLGRILTSKQASVLADICERLGVAG